MPKMHYVARTLVGERIEGDLRAADERDLREQLSLRGLEILSVQESGGRKTRAARAAAAGSKRVKLKILTEETGQLALMLRAGTSLVDCLDALAEQSNDERMTDVLQSVAGEVTGGSSLAVALASHPRVFDGFYVSSVRAGEASGNMAEVFGRLESYLQKRLELRGNIITSLIYPVIIMILAVAAVTFMITFVLPKFVGIFERSGVLLPLPTRMLMGISSFVVSYWYLLIGGGVAIGVAVYYYAKSSKGSRVMDRLVLHLPIIGPVANTVQSAVLLRSLGTLMGAGVPLVETLEVAVESCKNTLFQQFVRDITAGVVQGEDLASNFAKSDLMLPSTKQMVRTGERTGTLATVFDAVADHLEDNAERQMKRLSALFEPLILIVMGVVIGFIAVSVLLPLFRLTSAARGG
jgi:type IV pilus assembly protein PilC